MNTIIADTGVLRMPVQVTDLEAFRCWVHSEALPEDTRACFLDGEVWVDMSKEQLFSHNQVKSEFNIVLGMLAKTSRGGRYLPDGMLLTNTEANLSSQPNGLYFSAESLQSGRILLVEGAKSGIVEIEGSADMVLEIISDSSVEKDTRVLPDLYFRAGVAEFWRVDARGNTVSFEILRRGFTDFEAVENVGGWLKSDVFGRAFSLARQSDAMGHPEYTLSHRPA